MVILNMERNFKSAILNFDFAKVANSRSAVLLREKPANALRIR